ncbi:hypothetical protein V1506DRAFT_476061 [Lipomyces tetrasporus]
MPSLSLRPLQPMQTDSSSTISSGSSVADLSVVSSSSSSAAPRNLLSRLGRSSSPNGMTVVIDNQKPYYTAGDCLSGAVILTPISDTGFTDVLITLEGNAKTWSESSGVGNRINLKDTFLKMSSPVDEHDYPSLRIFRAGMTYTFKFSFVLPEHLLESQCGHLASHRHLPPSLGDPNLPSELDDSSPDMARITYQIVSKVLHIKDNGRRKSVPYSASASIAAVTAYVPDILNIPHSHYKNQELSLGDGGFTRFYRTTKTLKKGIISRSTTGSLTLEASVLKPFIHLKTESIPLLLALSYTPGAKIKKSEFEIPKVESVSVKLRVYTYFNTVPMTYMPHPESRVLDPRLGLYQESFTIANYNFTSTSSQLEWAKESDSHYSFNATIPLTPPKRRVLVPNFWSCFIGRQYEADVTVKLSGAGGGNIGLKIPVEVTTDKIADQVLNKTLSQGAHDGVLDMTRLQEDSGTEDDDDPVLEAFSTWASGGPRQLSSAQPRPSLHFREPIESRQLEEDTHTLSVCSDGLSNSLPMHPYAGFVYSR